MKKVFITGCGGMLGSSVYKVFNEAGFDILATDKDQNESWLEYLDVRDTEKMCSMIKAYNPDLIINLAAVTSLEYCEINLKEAFETNYLAAKNLAEIAQSLKIPMVHISTAGIFDGKEQFYHEDSIPNPINVYGKTKLYGELSVRHTLKDHFIIRPGWMFGGGKKDKKFISFIISQIKSGAQSLNVVNDKFGTPTYTQDLAKNMLSLIKTDNYGTYHMVCEGETNRVEMTKAILETLKLKDIKINEVDSKFFENQFPVQRASSERLKNRGLNSLGINQMRNWKDALNHYISDEWSDVINLKKETLFNPKEH